MTERKWNLPPEPIPHWLDPKSEVVGWQSPWKNLEKLEIAPLFVSASFVALLELKPTLPLSGIIGIIANAVVESGWGHSFQCWNVGGWKIKERDTKINARAKWFRAPGNRTSGDPPWCYYKSFDSLKEFYKLWIEKFVPQDSETTNRYHETGKQFWNDKTGTKWFPELIKAGYKGEVTKANPLPSIRSHEQIKEKCLVYLIQGKLGVEVDGYWGERSGRALGERIETSEPTVDALKELIAMGL